MLLRNGFKDGNMELCDCVTAQLKDVKREHCHMNKVKTKTTQVHLNYGNYSEQPFMGLIMGSSCHGSCLSFQIKLLPHLKL